MLSPQSRTASSKIFSDTPDVLANLTEQAAQQKSDFKVTNHLYMKDQLVFNLPEYKLDGQVFPFFSKYKRKNKTKYKVWNQSNGAFIIWSILMMLLIAIQMIEIPYVLAFDITDEILLDVDLAINYLFLVDIIIQFNTAIYLNGRIVKDRKIIALEYLKFWFWVDMSSSFPYDYILNDSNLESQAKAIKFLRFLKFIKILRLFKAMRIGKIIRHLEEIFNINYEVLQFIQVLKLFALIIVVAHWLACIWEFIASSEQYSWQDKYDIADQGTDVNYISALYYGVTTIATVGFGDIKAISITERLFAVFCMLLASTLFGYTASIITIIFQGQNDSFKIQEKLLRRYMKKKNISKHLTYKVINYLEWLWTQQQKQRIPQQQIIQSLSSNLKSELVCLINGRVIDEIVFLGRFSKDFQNNMAYALQEVLLCPEEVTHIPAMYYVVKGTCLRRIRKTKISISKDNYFGQEAIFSETSITIQGDSFVSLLRLDQMHVVEISKLNESDFEIYHEMKHNVRMNQYRCINRVCYFCGGHHEEVKCHKAQFVWRYNDVLKKRQIKQQIRRSFMKKQTLFNHDNSSIFFIQKKLISSYLSQQQMHKPGIVFRMINATFEIDQVKEFPNFFPENNFSEVVKEFNESVFNKLKNQERMKQATYRLKAMALTSKRKNLFLQCEKPRESIQKQFRQIVARVMEHNVRDQIVDSPKRNRLQKLGIRKVT